jgi:hypothetical protein
MLGVKAPTPAAWMDNAAASLASGQQTARASARNS